LTVEARLFLLIWIVECFVERVALWRVTVHNSKRTRKIDGGEGVSKCVIYDVALILGVSFVTIKFSIIWSSVLT